MYTPPSTDVSDEKSSAGGLKKKIALLINSLSIAGGAQRVAAQLAGFLNDYYDCYLICVYKDNEYFYEVDERVKVISLYAQAPRKMRYIYFSGAIKLSKFLKQQGIELLMVIDSGNGFIPFISKFLSPIKIIYCEHSTYNRYKMQYQTIKQKLKNSLFWLLIFRFSNYIVALTEKELKYYADSHSKYTFIYNPLDEKLMVSSKAYTVNSKAIITCGRIDYSKGYEYLIELAAKVLLVHSDWQWHIYGGGDEEYQKKLQIQIDKLGLSERLIFMGTHSDIYDIYPQYSFYVMTSRWEGFGMVLIEAKARRLPCVAFDIYSGPSDIIRDGVDGYLVPPFDIDALAEKINFLIEHPEERKRLAANARGNLDKFSKEKIVAQWRELIDSL